ARSKIDRAAASPVDMAVPPPAWMPWIACAAARRFAGVAWVPLTTTCAVESNATMKNHALSGSWLIAVTTAPLADAIRSPAIDPDLSMMNPMTSVPLGPDRTVASAVTVMIESTRVLPGGRNLFWNASSLKAIVMVGSAVDGDVSTVLVEKNGGVVLSTL